MQQPPVEEVRRVGPEPPRAVLVVDSGRPHEDVADVGLAADQLGLFSAKLESWEERERCKIHVWRLLL